MTGRELLERAAKAAGLDVHPGNGWQSESLFLYFDRPDGLFTAREWNPLESDADALRLAVSLRLEVAHNTFGNVIVDRYDQPMHSKVVMPHGSDPFAATRRAIVRAAAAIGDANGMD